MKNVISKNYKKLLVLFLAIASALVIAITAGFTLKPQAESSTITYQDFRSGEYYIKDEGPFKQSFDSIKYTDLKSANQGVDLLSYQYVTVDVRLEMKEKYKGYQQLFIYPTETGAYGDFVRRIEVQYGGDKCDKNYSYVNFKFKSIPLNELVTDGELNLVIRYGATGGGDDDWYNRNCTITVTLSNDVINSNNVAEGNITYDYPYNNP